MKCVVNRKRSGRQRITSVTEDRRIATTSKRNRLLTAPEITNIYIMNSSRKDPISTSKAGFSVRIAARRSLLRPQNKKRRLQWAKQHEQFTVND